MNAIRCLNDGDRIFSFIPVNELYSVKSIE